MGVLKLFLVLVVLAVALWVAQPWLQHFLGLAKPKALVEVIYSAFDITPAGDYSECNVTARIVVRNAGRGDAENIVLAMVLKESDGNWRLNTSIDAGALSAGKEMKNVTHELTTPCAGFYERNMLVGNASVGVASFQTAS